MTRSIPVTATHPTPGRGAPQPRERRYPIRCTDCGAREVRPAVIPYSLEKNHDGRLYRLHIPDLRVLRCDKCGQVLFETEADAQISAALRSHLRLLTPDEIRSNLQALSLSQKDFAARLGVAAETVSRWMNGALIQSRAMDNLMRVFFAIPQVREALSGTGQQ